MSCWKWARGLQMAASVGVALSASMTRLEAASSRAMPRIRSSSPGDYDRSDRDDRDK